MNSPLHKKHTNRPVGLTSSCWAGSRPEVRHRACCAAWLQCHTHSRLRESESSSQGLLWAVYAKEKISVSSLRTIVSRDKARKRVEYNPLNTNYHQQHRELQRSKVSLQKHGVYAGEWNERKDLKFGLGCWFNMHKYSILSFFLKRIWRFGVFFWFSFYFLNTSFQVICRNLEAHFNNF